MQSDRSKSNKSKTKRKQDKKLISNEKKTAKKLSELTRLHILSKPREVKASKFAPGPGSYDWHKADTAVRYKAQVASFSKSESKSKPVPKKTTGHLSTR